MTERDLLSPIVPGQTGYASTALPLVKFLHLRFRVWAAFLSATLVWSLPLGAEQTISGSELSGVLPKNLTIAGSPYIIAADVFVQPGSTVTVEPGVVLMFNAFTGLHIQGTLLASGTPKEPVVFTSINDRKHNPSAPVDAAPYDWNGIDIYEDGIGTDMQHCVITYSVYGIRAQTPFIRVGNCRIAFSGKTDFTIKGKELELKNKVADYAPSQVDVRRQGIPVRVVRDPNAVPKALVRYTGIALGISGLALGGWAAPRFVDDQKRMDRYASLSEEEKVNVSITTYEKDRQARNKSRSLTLVGIGAFLLGITGFSISFAF